ncbi:MAG: metalloregulator ArsR/SmtB family transcription factor [bacterium]|nr:metalloregulator ArsR/SmtB family transcription factor [bacterium]
MESIADVFKALGDPTRLRIVEMLSHSEEICVCKITEELGMTQPAISHHLSTLKHAGLVAARRHGQWMHYSLCREVLRSALQPLLAWSAEKPQAVTTGDCNCDCQGNARR